MLLRRQQVVAPALRLHAAGNLLIGRGAVDGDDDEQAI
jgi:hypothetical protein